MNQNLSVDDWQNWDSKSKERLFAGLQAAEKKRKVFYCARGRECNGEPHDVYDYDHARSDQWPPAGQDWLTWLMMGGRGSGKTRGGSEFIRKCSMKIRRTSIIGPSLEHIRNYMVEGESGLQVVFDNAKQGLLWEPSKKKLTLDNGHIIQAFTAEEPARLRGPAHGIVWLDEPAHMPLIQDVWDNMMFGLRLKGSHPHVCCTTTPLPIKWLTDLLKEDDTVVTRASTYANLRNLAPAFRDFMLKKYEGTRLGRQELYGEVLEDVEGALWSWQNIEDNRDLTIDWHLFERIIVGVDPAGSSDRKRDETGIIVVGKLGNDYYVLFDGSGHYTPNGWAKRVWELVDMFEADLVVAEKNYGGEMVLSTLRNERPDGNVELVNSRRGKVLRAEPISGLYEQNRVHHTDLLVDLENQMTTWVPSVGSSPDRVDALVHAITKLSGDTTAETTFASPPAASVTQGMPSMFGYSPRANTSIADERARLVEAVALQPLEVLAPCDHPSVFDHHSKPGVMVCGTCLCEVEWHGEPARLVRTRELIGIELQARLDAATPLALLNEALRHEGKVIS